MEEQSLSLLDNLLISCTKSQLHGLLYLYFSGNCCCRCCFRFINYRDNYVFQQKENVLETSFRLLLEKMKAESAILSQIVMPESSSLKEPCTACFGLLQESRKPQNNHNLGDELLEKLATCSFEYRDLCFSFSLPPSIIIRQFSLWYWLQKQCRELEGSLNFQSEVPNVIEVKEALRWFLSSLVKKSCLSVEFNPQSEFTASFCCSHEETKEEYSFLQLCIDDTKLENRKRRVEQKMVKPKENSLHSIEKILELHVSKEKFLRYGQVPPSLVRNYISFEIIFQYAPIYIGGRYIKRDRSLSQTLWIIDGKRKTETSVEELLAKEIVPFFKAEGFKFHTAGREDADVRMLGTGRPFIFELSNPHRTSFPDNHFSTLAENINRNSRVGVIGLRRVSKWVALMVY